MPVVIREAQVDDAASMIAMLNPIIEAGSHTALCRPYTVDEQAEFVRSFPQRGVLHVAVEEASNEILGMQDVAPASDLEALSHVGAIGTFVKLDAHRRGIGRALFSRTIQAAQNKAYRKLLATIRADNPTAIAFYAGHQFQHIGIAREHAFINGKYIDEVLMERVFSSG